MAGAVASADAAAVLSVYAVTFAYVAVVILCWAVY